MNISRIFDDKFCRRASTVLLIGGTAMIGVMIYRAVKASNNTPEDERIKEREVVNRLRKSPIKEVVETAKDIVVNRKPILTASEHGENVYWGRKIVRKYVPAMKAAVAAATMIFTSHRLLKVALMMGEAKLKMEAAKRAVAEMHLEKVAGRINDIHELLSTNFAQHTSDSAATGDSYHSGAADAFWTSSCLMDAVSNLINSWRRP